MDDDIQSPGYSIAMPGPPFSPWVRLAHVWRIAGVGHDGEGIALRRLRDWECFFQLDGQTRIALPDGRHALDMKAGSLALIPPGMLHGWAPLSAGAHLAVHFDLHAQPDLEPLDMIDYAGRHARPQRLLAHWQWTLDLDGQPHRMPLAAAMPDPRVWRERLMGLTRLYAHDQHRSPQARLTAAAVMGDLVAWFLAQAGDETGDPLMEELAAAARQQVGEMGVADIARRAGMGQTALRAAVRRRTGYGVREAVERLRLDRAAYALRAGSEPVAVVAAAVGFADPFHFSRAFKRVYGQAPKEWRRG